MKHDISIKRNIIPWLAKSYGITENVYDDDVLIVAAARQSHIK